ncbi:hypothetical protein B5K06_30545 [Rhizobium grahamii]|uniref:Transmembrane protein n=2 Tax=Rhizobium grahamii TaxID=1120045 RepID=S3HC33_9HYPH|nr:hypothetical protein RGCCGE502_20375 [Rhizobium grahamii CCGE 502]RDJ03146.1 hypothetical protein B5K06_30545 [Rhizobium grahamii]
MAAKRKSAFLCSQGVSTMISVKADGTAEPNMQLQRSWNEAGDGGDSMRDRSIGLLIAVEVCALFWIATAFLIFGTH